MSYTYQASETFWKNFYKLPSQEKEWVRQAWHFFKTDPFHPRLGTHKIHVLSAKAKKNIYSVVAGPDLRILFYIENNTVFTIDVGSHDLYKI